MTSEHSRELQVSNRLLAAWEIASVTISILMAEWIMRPFGGADKLSVAIPSTLAIVLMLLSHRARGETPRSIGWRLDNIWRAARLLALPVFFAAILIVVAGFLTGGLGAEKWRGWRWLLWLPVWALIQQYALQGFVNRRAQIVFGAGYRSILLVAALFALLHLPNPYLTGITFVGGVVWAAVYQRAPNLPALAIAHALVSMLLVWAVPARVLGSLSVGIRYFLLWGSSLPVR